MNSNQNQQRKVLRFDYFGIGLATNICCFEQENKIFSDITIQQFTNAYTHLQIPKTFMQNTRQNFITKKSGFQFKKL